MLVKGRTDLVYFAFPKCASEWMRKELDLWWRNIYNVDDWAKCDIDYCHIQPSRFLREKDVNLENAVIFTIVRNTYDRLASAWRYGVAEKHAYAAEKTFKQFIGDIYANRDDLTKMQHCWMFLPLDVYFGKDLIEKVRVFHIDKLEELECFLKDGYGLVVNKDNIVNKTGHQAATMYDQEMVDMVNQVFKYEIERFGYTCNHVLKS